MEKTLLQTKLYIPPTRPGHVKRPRLLNRLDEGLEQPRVLTLISAPAGYGKSSLAVEWIHERHRPIAWFSVDKFDNEPNRFFGYLFAAVQTVNASLGEELSKQLNVSDVSSPMSLMTALINEFTSFAGDQMSEPGHQITLVLDDYHSITEPTIHESMDVLLEHPPPQMHVIIVTRHDPPLALSRLRARDRLNEIRQTDLQFSAEESTDFFTRSMALWLTKKEIETLTERTEGWAAGLQLAGLSMAELNNVERSEFITGFSGRHHFILDYLADEVLKRQPEPVQAFLTYTSILDRMCSDLCDAVLEGAKGVDSSSYEGSQKLLEQLTASNLFIHPLDNERRWYRYHHLFAELLRARLSESQPEFVPELHHRTALWFERNGAMSEAVNHEFLTGDMELAANMLGRVLKKFDTWTKVEVKTFLKWLQLLPADVLRNRPWLRLFTARSLYVTGRTNKASSTLETLEQWLEEHQESPDAEQLMGLVWADRASYAVVQGEASVGIAYAQHSIDNLPDSNTIGHMRAQAILGLSLTRIGDVVSAEKAFANAIDLADKAELGFGLTPLVANLADVQIAQGRLSDALASCDYAIDLGTVDGKRVASSGFASLEIGKILYQRNNLQEAEGYFHEALDLLKQGGITQSFGVINSELAFLQQALGHWSESLDLAHEAVDLANREGIERITVLAKAYQARIWLAQGSTGLAVQWADDYLALEPVEYLREFEDLTLVQTYLISDRPEEALAVLDSSIEHAHSYGRLNSIIHIGALQTLALDALGKRDAALKVLEFTLNLAEPEGYRRVFLNLGLPMARLLYQAAAREIGRTYIAKLLAAFEEEPALARAEMAQPEMGIGPKLAILVEPLSQRETEVLELLALGLSNREIADRLILSPHTIRSHTYNLYGKLGVHSRTQAVARARELGLLT